MCPFLSFADCLLQVVSHVFVFHSFSLTVEGSPVLYFVSLAFLRTPCVLLVDRRGFSGLLLCVTLFLLAARFVSLHLLCAFC